jgi:hypothetical protein
VLKNKNNYEKEDVKMHTTKISESDGSACVELWMRKLENRTAI